MITQQERLIKHVESDLVSLAIDSDCLAEDIQYIRDNKIESISLNHIYGFNLDNIDFLKEIPFIRELHMGASPSVTNFSGLKYLVNLEELIMDPPRNSKVDLSEQQKLKFLSFEYNPRITGFEYLKNLKRLWVWNGTPDFFKAERFPNYKYLEELQIYLSKIDNLLFLKECSLKELVFDHDYKEFSLNGLETQNSLQVLKFITCHKVVDIEQLSALTSLKTLIIYDSFKLPSCRIIQDMKHLENLTLTGASYFEEGDLMPIKDIINGLKNNYITQRKNYNIKVR